MKLDLGCGYRLNPGHTGIDIVPMKKLFPGLVPLHYIDNFVELDLFHFPWPIDDASVDDVILRYFVEYIPHMLPDQGRNPLASKLDGFYLFFEELYRVMVPYGKVHVIHLLPNLTTGDPSVRRMLPFETWRHLSKDWRDENIVEDPATNFHLESHVDDGAEAVVVLDCIK